jgi:tetratricopeptide (TPR) repeat protein
MDAAKKVINQGAKEEEEVLQAYQYARQYKYLSDTLKIFIKTKGIVKGEEDTRELESILEHPLLNSEQKAISYSTKYSFFHLYSKCYSVMEDYKHAYPYCNKLVDLIESHPEQIVKKPQAYLLALNHLLAILKELRKFDEFEEALKKLKSVQSKTVHFQSRAFSYIFIHEWNLSFYTGKYQQCISLIPFLEEGLQKYDNQITSDLKFLFYFDVFYGYFVLEQYQQAIKWLNKILNDKRTEIRQDIRNFGMVVNIILHYEMKDYDLLEYLIRSAQRLLEKEKDAHKFELLVLAYMKRLIKGQSAAEQRKMFIQLRNKLLFANLENYLIAFSRGSSEKIILNTFDILAWLESKIEDRPFASVLFEKEKDKQKKPLLISVNEKIEKK